MKKKVYGRKLSRSLTARKALFRALIKSLIENDRIETTLAKAKAVQADVERLVAKAKKGGVAKRREVYAYLANDKLTTHKLFTEVVQAFGLINSGFTRIVKLPPRRGDLAEMARLEWSREVGDFKAPKKAKNDERKKIQKSKTKVDKKNILARKNKKLSEK